MFYYPEIAENFSYEAQLYVDYINTKKINSWRGNKISMSDFVRLPPLTQIKKSVKFLLEKHVSC